jgi:hypothetical protein
VGVKRIAKDQPNGDMLRRLQGMLYEFHDMGRFEEARPHILWLMEIAEAQGHHTGPANAGVETRPRTSQ